MNRIFLGLVLAAGAALAQEFHEMINFDSLRLKADETVEVNLDGNLLKMAMAFLSDKDPDEAQAKRLIGGIKGIYVRSLKFDKPGMYSTTDIEKIRSLLKPPQWAKIVSVESKKNSGDNVGIFIKTDGAQMQGLVVLSFEPEELTVVNIVGVIDPAQVRSLNGKLGIPMIWNTGDHLRRNGKDDRDKDKDKDKDKEEEQ
jgi:hypothetical protein